MSGESEQRYLAGLSNDLIVSSHDFGDGRAALAMDLLSFCTDCGCVVYRRDLHDQWHKQLESRPAPAEKLEDHRIAQEGAKLYAEVDANELVKLEKVATRCGMDNAYAGTLLQRVIARIEDLYDDRIQDKPATEGVESYWGVFVLDSKEPIAIFEYPDMANEWAEENYRGRSEVRPHAIDSARSGAGAVTEEEIARTMYDAIPGYETAKWNIAGPELKRRWCEGARAVLALISSRPTTPRDYEAEGEVFANACFRRFHETDEVSFRKTVARVYAEHERGKEGGRCK